MEFEKLDNEKLLEKYQEIMAEQLSLLKEFYSRLNSGGIGDSEYERYKEISENASIVIMDMLPSQADKRTVENVVRETVSNVVKKVFDEHR